MEVIKCLMRQSSCYKGTTKGVPVGILWHDTGAGNPNIRRYVQPDDDAPDRTDLLRIVGVNQYKNDYNHVNLQKGVNAFVGKLADGTVGAVQVLPWDFRPWGCGSGKYGSCNGRADKPDSPFWIQFEICDDGYKNADYFRQACKATVELTAYLCKMFNIDPNGSVNYSGVSVPTILCHADAHALGLGSNHGDVLGWFKRYGHSMADVRRDVTAILASEPQTTVSAPSPWAAEACRWAVENGLFAGDGNGEYNWQQPVTREQLACILKAQTTDSKK